MGEFSDDTRFLKSGGILWSSERSGFRHLYLYDGSNLVRQITSGDWIVTRVVAVDEDRGVVYFEGTRWSIVVKNEHTAAPIEEGEDNFWATS